MTAADSRALVVGVRLLEGRFHGEPEWPPSPARLFQALVSGASRGEVLDDAATEALSWLEGLAPPLVAAPPVRRGQLVKLWVPNNDLDAKGGDPAEVPSLRTGKLVRPWILGASAPPISYVWRLGSSEDEGHAVRVCALASEIYQLGRGVDMAAAQASILTGAACASFLGTYPGRIYRPNPGAGAGERSLLCARPGSLRSLQERHAAALRRFSVEKEGGKAVQVFQQPPKALFDLVPFEAAPPRALFDLRPQGDVAVFSTTALWRSGPLTEAVRDAAAARLTTALPRLAADIERGLVGRPVEGHALVPAEHRIRIIPLPSIGHLSADRGVRRVLVEVPYGNPLRADDVFWAFSGLQVQTPAGPETVVTPADDHKMEEHFGIGTAGRFRRWQTVTAAALPVARRRIDPRNQAGEAKPGSERAEEERQAVHAVKQALRHAGIEIPAVRVQVQREPFTAKGARAEQFATDMRFQKERFWHVDITFRGPVSGPIVLGDGRFVGLGLMAPVVNDVPGVLAYRVTGGLEQQAPWQEVSGALRRAVMSRAQAKIGEGNVLPSMISGHEQDGRPTSGKPRFAYVFDEVGQRLLVIAPHSMDRLVRGGPALREPTRFERSQIRTLLEALEGFCELRSGRAGLLSLAQEEVDTDCDPLLASSRRWVSRTPYAVNRHLDRKGAHDALAADLRAACREAGLPEPEVVVRRAWTEEGTGLVGQAELRFGVAIPGPLVLGRTRFKGGGLFGHAAGGAAEAR